MKNKDFFILTGASGVGKTTLICKISRRFQFYPIINDIINIYIDQLGHNFSELIEEYKYFCIYNYHLQLEKCRHKIPSPPDFSNLPSMYDWPILPKMELFDDLKKCLYYYHLFSSKDQTVVIEGPAFRTNHGLSKFESIVRFLHLSYTIHILPYKPNFDITNARRHSRQIPPITKQKYDAIYENMPYKNEFYSTETEIYDYIKLIQDEMSL